MVKVKELEEKLKKKEAGKGEKKNIANLEQSFKEKMEELERQMKSEIEVLKKNAENNEE